MNVRAIFEALEAAGTNVRYYEPGCLVVAGRAVRFKGNWLHIGRSVQFIRGPFDILDMLRRNKVITLDSNQRRIFFQTINNNQQ